MDLLRSLLGVGENQPKNVVDDDGEKTTKTGCSSGFLCQRAGDPVPSGNICPSCSLPVHPLCEVWNAEQEEHICLLCEKNTRNRFSTAPSPDGEIDVDGYNNNDLMKKNEIGVGAVTDQCREGGGSPLGRGMPLAKKPTLRF